MSKKIIASTAVAVATITIFTITSQPKTTVGTAAMSVGDFYNESRVMAQANTRFTMPTMPPFPDLHVTHPTSTPVVSSNPQTTISPTVKPTTAAKTASPTTAVTAQPARTTTPKSTAQATTQATSSNSSYVDQVVSLVNKERSKAGLVSLSKNNQLTNSAQGYAQYMADGNFFAHVGPNGSTFITRNKAAGYTPYHYLGENIAAGQRSPQEVMTAWMNSSGHRANILKPEFKEIGVGYMLKRGTAYGTYWVQEFGAK